ncbi:MAG: precorrin-6y C5,15-methyltransferase (decarboxylating) subunit CbiE [Desulfoplanes sp.]|nr:precorrin-6y C5,15-methyltransferase (decarboxylating) subunit CbiE [Desulfoplanes sp.]
MIEVIGLGLNPDFLPPAYRHLIDQAEILAGGNRQLALFPHAPGKKQGLAPSLSHVLEILDQEERAGTRIVVLADGDPLTFGIGTTLIKKMGISRVRIHPGLSTPQTAAARLGKGIKDLDVVSLHGRNDWAPLFASLTHHPLTGIFTDATNSPARIAGACLNRGLTRCIFHIFEDLEGPKEQTVSLTLEEAQQRRDSSLSFVIIEQQDFRPLCFGTADSAFVHERGLITKSLVRAAGLATLHLHPDDIVWDLGAGCGSVCIEGAALLRRGQAFAVEAKPHRMDMIRENIRRFRAWLVEPVLGTMPEALNGLPDPDRIFMGGGARDVQVLTTAMDRLKPGGRLVIHAILLETLETVRKTMADRGWPCSLAQMSGSISDPVAGATRLKPFNPVFIIQADKPENA